MNVTKDQAELAYKVYKRMYKAKMESKDYNLGVKSWIKKVKSELNSHTQNYVATINYIPLSLVKQIKELDDFTIDKL